MKAGEASACLQALSSDCWSINGAVLYLRDKLENTALGANMLMRIITASSELSRNARKQKDVQMGKMHLQSHTPPSCWIWVTTPCARIEVDISLCRKWPRGTIRASPTQIKNTQLEALLKAILWHRKTEIKLPGSPPLDEKQRQVCLDIFMKRLCQGDGRRETGSLPLNFCSTIRVFHPSMRFSKAAHWFPLDFQAESALTAHIQSYLAFTQRPARDFASQCLQQSTE